MTAGPFVVAKKQLSVGTYILCGRDVILDSNNDSFSSNGHLLEQHPL